MNRHRPLPLLSFALACTLGSAVVAHAAADCWVEGDVVRLQPGTLRVGAISGVFEHDSGTGFLPCEGDAAVGQTSFIEILAGDVGDEATIDLGSGGGADFDFDGYQAISHVHALTVLGSRGDDTITWRGDGRLDVNGDESGGYIDYSFAITVKGGLGNDNIDGSTRSRGAITHGGPGNDTIIGSGAGGDLMTGGSGDDQMDGGTPITGTVGDSVGFDEASGPVRLDFTSSEPQDTGEGFDTVVGFEGVVGSRYDDVFWSSPADESFIGGQGRDLVSYAKAPGPVLFDLREHDQDTGAGGKDRFPAGIEGVEGSPYADTFIGNSRSNTLLGGQGDDRIRGLQGDDFLEGGAGADDVVGASGNDVLRGGAGDDRLDGTTGNDLLHGGAGRDVMTAGRGADRVFGGDGDDDLDVLDDQRDRGSAGTGSDRCRRDKVDRVNSCERRR